MQCAHVRWRACMRERASVEGSLADEAGDAPKARAARLGPGRAAIYVYNRISL